MFDWRAAVSLLPLPVRQFRLMNFCANLRKTEPLGTTIGKIF
jgi:hypothetical protein